MTSVGDPLVGQVLDGRYQITARLARGGMATVYQAVDTRLTRTVAVKVMHVGLGDDAEFARKFDHEARAAARLSHPNVVSVFDQGQAVLDGHSVRPYIVMEYVEGPTLRNVIVRETPMAPARALEVLEPVLGALAAAHDAGLVHRDVKPENVLISGRGQIKVADFGLAKAVSSQTSTATSGLLIGTVSYLPPELVLSGRADARSDVYSAGVVLFELLTGLKPHTGETPIQVAYAHVHNDVPAPSTIHRSSWIPPYVDALVLAATARDAAARPQDARVLLDRVRRARAALREGRAGDAGLTQELGRVRVGGRDRADSERTQVVPAGGTRRGSVGYPTQAPLPAREAHGSHALAAPAASSVSTRRGAGPAPARGGPRQLSAQRATALRERELRRRRRGWLALLLVLLVAASALLLGWYLVDGRFTTAPALSSLTRSDAQQASERAGLDLRTGEAYSETVPAGVVISTEPGAGAKIVDGGQIEAVVSRGPERHPMPRVAGLTRAAAATAVAAAGLGAPTVTEAWSDAVPAGEVVRASATAGVGLPPGTPVTLTVSKGPQPVSITDHRGEPADEAVTALRRAGFRVRVATESSADVPAGRVAGQDPATGTGHRGDRVTLTRSSGPELVTVPNVQAMEVRAAEQVLQQAGFTTEVRPSTGDGPGLGFVISTAPRARSQAPRGSSITLNLG